MSGIAQNLSNVLTRVREAERRAFRDEMSVRLVAVSKFHPASSVIEALEAGQILFGENRIQEAAAKFDEVRSKGFSPSLHIIGSLQRNKVREAVRIADCIESVDRTALLEEIERHCAVVGRRISVLFEFRTGEDSKAGFTDEGCLREAVGRCAAGDFPHVIPRGFMTMAPLTDDTALVRKSFVTLRNLRDKLQSEFTGLDLHELSMGMSGDYETAIEEGATIVRVGTAIFGERASL